MTLARLFQLLLFIYIVVVPVLNINGPCYETMPINEEQPGPPLSHNTTGSLEGSAFWLNLL